MGVEVGDAIPNVEIRVLGDDGRPTPVNTGDILGSGKVVLFAVPGAFTPGCSNLHLPTYTEGAADLAGAGVDLVACVAVNDVWVMGAWSGLWGRIYKCFQMEMVNLQMQWDLPWMDPELEWVVGRNGTQQ